jgi:hypothetical protein
VPVAACYGRVRGWSEGGNGRKDNRRKKEEGGS